MIPAGLEKLIWQGKAVFKNYSYAFGQIGGIPIPDNSICIIIGFKYGSCLLSPGDDTEIELSNKVHLLRIESDKTVNDYIIRNKEIITGTGETLRRNLTGPDPDFESYIVASKSIQIKIALVPKNENGNIAFSLNTPPQESNEQDPPLGFNTENVLMEVNTGAGIYNPLAERNKTASPNSDRNQFNVNFNADTLFDLANSQQDFDDDGYPIINFRLVYVNKDFASELLGSK